jgi:transcriptional regulator with XRE-family HTH domain
MSIGSRIREARKSSNYTGRDLAKLLGLPQSAISRIENDQQLPNSEQLNLIHGTFLLNAEWLLTGNGEMFVGDAPGNAQEQSKGQVGVTPPPSLKTCSECGQPYNVAPLLEEKDRRLEEKDKMLEEKERQIVRLEEELKKENDSALVAQTKSRSA